MVSYKWSPTLFGELQYLRLFVMFNSLGWVPRNNFESIPVEAVLYSLKHLLFLREPSNMIMNCSCRSTSITTLLLSHFLGSPSLVLFCTKHIGYQLKVVTTTWIQIMLFYILWKLPTRLHFRVRVLLYSVQKLETITIKTMMPKPNLGLR